MTKKDYILISDAIRESKDALLYATVNAEETRRTLDIVAQTLSAKLARDNDRFDNARFIEACGVQSFDSMRQ